MNFTLIKFLRNTSIKLLSQLIYCWSVNLTPASHCVVEEWKKKIILLTIIIGDEKSID